MVRRATKNTKKTKVKRRNAKSSSTIKSKSTVVVDKATRVLKARHLESVCAEIESLRGANGRIPRGEMTKVYEQNKAIYSWLTIDIIKKCLKKRKDKGPTPDTTIISDLTDDSTNDPPPLDNPPNVPPPSSIGVNQTLQNDSCDSRKKGGRPKGATIRASRDKAEQTEVLIQEIASEWSEKVKANSKGRMKKNELEEFIEQKKEEKGLTNVSISKSLHPATNSKKFLSASHCGTVSPMAPVEEYIVSLMQQMAKMRQPLNVSEGLSLSNSLVEGTEWENKIVEFKTKRGWKRYAVDGSKNPILGPKWYKGFWKRHAHVLEKKRAKVFKGSIRLVHL